MTAENKSAVTGAGIASRDSKAASDAERRTRDLLASAAGQVTQARNVQGAEVSSVYDYSRQCWIIAGKVAACGHREKTAGCYACAHVGESVGVAQPCVADFEKLGFAIEETGGGCQWMRLQIDENISFVITDGEAGLPTEASAQLFVVCGEHSDALANGEAMPASALAYMLRKSGIGLKQYKVTSTTKVCAEPFVDWYEARSKAEALELARDDAHRYGLPTDTKFEVILCPKL